MMLSHPHQDCVLWIMRAHAQLALMPLSQVTHVQSILQLPILSFKRVSWIRTEALVFCLIAYSSTKDPFNSMP